MIDLIIPFLEQFLSLLLIQIFNHDHILNCVGYVSVLLVPYQVVVHLRPTGAGEDFGQFHLKLLEAIATFVQVYGVNERIGLLLGQNIAFVLCLICRHILSLHL